MTYEEVVDKIENIRRFGNQPGVEVTAHMLRDLGNPQQGMRLIHIAGTNGKGSVSAFLCEILRAAGMKTGVFTSPHLVDFRERICVNGNMIEKEAVREIGMRLLMQKFDACPTMFDYCLVMALLYFKEQQCDVVILETGLGGRLDSTNAVGIPEITIITKIGYDHMDILGETLEKIAGEKAGIIKKGTTVILESQPTEVLSVFLRAVKKAKAHACYVIHPDEFTDCCYEEGEQSFCYGTYGKLQMQMLGIHQYENAATAIVAAEKILKNTNPMKGIEEQTGGDTKRNWITKCICEGVYRTRWQGRMEILRRQPFLMVDGAHNSNGVAALKESLSVLFPDEKFHFIMGVMADKDYERMVEELLPLAIDFKTVTVSSERALQAKELADCIRGKGVPAVSETDLKRCLAAEENDTAKKTVAFGSLYFVGEIKTIFQKDF